MKIIPWFVLVFVMFFTIEQGVLEQNSWAVDPNSSSEYLLSLNNSKYNLVYKPDTGLLYKVVTQKNNEQTETYHEIKSFGPIIGLNSSEIDLVFENEKLALVQHGPWVSLIDVENDKVEFANIGPFEKNTQGNSKFIDYNEQDGKPFSLTFLMESFDQGKSVKRNFFLIYNFEEKKLNFLYLNRNDKNKILNLTSTGLKKTKTKKLFLTLDFQPYEISKTILNEEGKSTGKVEKVSITPDSIKVYVDFLTNVVDVAGSTEFIDAKSHTQSTSIISLMPADSSFFLKHFESKSFKDKELLDTASPGDEEIFKALVGNISQSLDKADAIKEVILGKMKHIRGQTQAKEEFVRISQDQMLGSNKLSVVLLAGPTGVGKTSMFHAWIGALFPSSKDAVYEINLGQFPHSSFLSTNLFGSTQGYVGFDSPTGLMLWILDHPEGGGIFFDEVEKMESAGLNILLKFIESGEVKMHPAMVKNVVAKLLHSKTPTNLWHPALREATKDGKNNEVEVVLKLDPNKYKIGFGSNAGAWLYNSLERNSDGSYDNESLKKLNQRFTVDVVKNELMQMGVKAEFIGRIQEIIPFGMLTYEEHSQVVEDKIKAIAQELARKFLIELKVTPELFEFLKTKSFNPPVGARGIENLLNAWIKKNVNDALTKRLISPGNFVVLELDQKDKYTKPTILLFTIKKGEPPSFKTSTSINVALPIDVGPILKYAEENLAKTFQKRIIGHTEETQAITNLVLARLKKAKNNPNPRERFVEMFYEEGPPGNGKTERAKAAAEGVFGVSPAFVEINGNSIATYDDFVEYAVKPLIKASLEHPEGLYVLWDELPRMGSAHPSYAASIQNALLSIIDKGILPAIPRATRVVNGKVEADTRQTALPTFTVFHATGNLFEQALTRDGGQMSNRQLHAEKRFMLRHPERLIAVLEKNIIPALRSRMGDPIVGDPLLDSEVEMLRDRFFEKEVRGPMLKRGVDIQLSASAKDFFVNNYVPILGGRWVRKQMSILVESPIIGTLDQDLTNERFKESHFEVVFDKKKEEMILVAKSKATGEITEGIRLGKFRRTVSQYSKQSLAQAEFMIRIHEAGHAIVRRVLVNSPGSVEEINVFGGIYGGWMEPGINVPSLEIYTSSRSGILKLAELLGGHVAEEVFLGVTSTGASNDYERTRDTATSMLINGGTLGLAPVPLVRNPSNGLLEVSEKNKADLELKQTALMQVSKKLAHWIIEHNRLIVMRIADAIARNPDMSIGSDEVERIISKSNLVVPTQKDLKQMIKGSRLTKSVCSSLLMPQPDTLWQRLKQKFVNERAQKVSF